MRVPCLFLTGAAVAALLGLPQNVGAAPASSEQPALQESVMRRKAFPFAADCEGNTQELVACSWQQRDAIDSQLLRQLGGARLLERWRQVRFQVCQKAAARYAGGSIQPVIAFSCENALNAALAKQLSGTLADPAP